MSAISCGSARRAISILIAGAALAVIAGCGQDPVQSGGVQSGGVQSGGVQSGGVQSGGVQSGGVQSSTADSSTQSAGPEDSGAAQAGQTTPDAAASTQPATTAAASAAPLSLKDQVVSYSDAYLGGDPDKAFAILSDRCQLEIGKQGLTTQIELAGELYGKLPLRSYSEKIAGSTATVTYGYDVKRLNQTDQPWVRVDGHWRYDSC